MTNKLELKQGDIDPKTRDKIDRRIRELTHDFEVGKTYRLRNPSGQVVERTVIEIGKHHMMYLRNGVPTKCQIKTFKRVFDEYGIGEVSQETR